MSNRGHCSDSERFISTCKDLQEHGRHPKSLQDSLRRRYCVPRCVPRFSDNLAKLIDWLRRSSKLRVTSHKETLRDRWTERLGRPHSRGQLSYFPHLRLRPHLPPRLPKSGPPRPVGRVGYSADGSAINDGAADNKVYELVHDHSNMSGADVVAALKQFGTKYGPDDKEPAWGGGVDGSRSLPHRKTTRSRNMNCSSTPSKGT
jgi:hypothetical protein